MKILLVNTDHRRRQIEVETLTDMGGHGVHAAQDGEDALKKLRSFPAELLITYNEMPVLEGHQLIARVKQAHPDMRTILVGNNPNIQQLGAACGADKVYTKNNLQWGAVILAIDEISRQPKTATGGKS